jgi:hypothetical protein
MFFQNIMEIPQKRESKNAYLSTTTTGDSVFVTTIKVFQIINAEHTIMPKFSPYKRNYTGLRHGEYIIPS